MIFVLNIYLVAFRNFLKVFVVSYKVLMSQFFINILCESKQFVVSSSINAQSFTSFFLQIFCLLDYSLPHFLRLTSPTIIKTGFYSRHFLTSPSHLLIRSFVLCASGYSVLCCMNAVADCLNSYTRNFGLFNTASQLNTYFE